MTSSTTDNVPTIERLRSAVPGFDQILGGGLFRTGVYIIQGLPGCGKTILANQICYGHVAEGGSAVYVTLLAESHSRMIQHLSTLSFFDVKAFPDKLAYISAFHDLETAGLKGPMAVLRREMRTRKVGVLVLDGLVAASEGASDLDLKKFIHELQSIAVLQDCTVLLLTSGNIHRMAAEHTMVDGLVELEDKLFDARTERSIQVRKFRGAGPLRGKHSLRIDNDGITVFPRIESLYRIAAADTTTTEAAVTSGIPSLDGLLAISISTLHRGYLIWFRPERLRLVLWAGDPQKPVRYGEDGDLAALGDRFAARVGADLPQDGRDVMVNGFR